MIWRTPRQAWPTPSGSWRCPHTTSTGWDFSQSPPGDPGRQRQRTASPAPTRRRTTWRPRNPPAPVTRIMLSPPEGRAIPHYAFRSSAVERRQFRQKRPPADPSRSVAGWPVHANTLGGIQGATSAGEGTNRAISPGAARGAMPLALARGLGEEGRKDCLDASGPALGALDSFAVTLADGHGQRESLSTPAAAKIVSRHGHPPEECRRVDGSRQAIVVGGEGSRMPLAASEAAASSA